MIDEKNNTLLINNHIVESKKLHNAKQLDIFYKILFLFRKQLIKKVYDEHGYNIGTTMSFDEALVEYVEYNERYSIEELTIDLDEFKRSVFNYRISTENIFKLFNSMPDKIDIINKNNPVGRIYIFDSLKYDQFLNTLTIKLSKTMENYLIMSMDNFAKIELLEFIKLKKISSKRLYELTKIYLNQNQYLMKIDDFKNFFNVPDYYQFSDIDKYLNRAIEEIEQNTSIKISYEKKKKHKCITHILFIWQENKQDHAC